MYLTRLHVRPAKTRISPRADSEGIEGLGLGGGVGGGGGWRSTEPLGFKISFPREFLDTFDKDGLPYLS